MQAVILGAGLGTRINELTKGVIPKGLIKVAGREILYRLIYYLKKYGIQEFIIVINPKFQEEYKKFFETHQFSVKFVLNPYPEKGNGYSLYLAKDLIKDKFVLVMSDHLYEEEFIKKAIEGEGLIVDRKGKFIDPEEATKVKVFQDKVVDIGKNLKDYQGFDTGFFVLTPEIFEVTQSLVNIKEKIELSEIVKKANLKVTFIDGYFWMDVDTPQDFKIAKKYIIKNTVKDRGDGLVSRFLNRKISTRISYYLVDKITPDQATFLTFLIGLIASAVAFVNVPLGGILYQISSILDGIDGEIARARLSTSKLGGYIDSLLDRFVDFAFLLALIWNISFSFQLFFIICWAIFGSIMVSYSTERYKAAFGQDIYAKIKILNYLPGKRDERIFLIMLFCLFNKIAELFIIIAVITNLRVLLTMFLVWKVERG